MEKSYICMKICDFSKIFKGPTRARKRRKNAWRPLRHASSITSKQITAKISFRKNSVFSFFFHRNFFSKKMMFFCTLFWALVVQWYLSFLKTFKHTQRKFLKIISAYKNVFSVILNHVIYFPRPQILFKYHYPEEQKPQKK